MKFSSPAERAALVRMVAASADLIIQIGRAIRSGVPLGDPLVRLRMAETSEEFVDSIIGVQESEEEAAKESYR